MAKKAKVERNIRLEIEGAKSKSFVDLRECYDWVIANLPAGRPATAYDKHNQVRGMFCGRVPRNIEKEVKQEYGHLTKPERDAIIRSRKKLAQIEQGFAKHAGSIPSLSARNKELMNVAADIAINQK
jgi:hypothetical protein